MGKAKFYFQSSDAPQPNRPPRIGVVALIERGDALLLECRTDSGQWSLIGGAVDLTESLTQALAREVWEETGLTVCGYELYGIFSDPSRIVAYPDGNIFPIITIAYRVQVAEGAEPVPSHESSELRFVPRHELAQYDIALTHRQIIEAYLEGRSIVLK